MDTILYKEEVWFTGRNGAYQQTGMAVKEITGAVKMQPLTRKGAIGHCAIEIPLDDIPELIGHLSSAYRRKIAAEIDTKLSKASDEELVAELEKRNLLTLK